MKKPYFARPNLEGLEDRLCPALDFFFNPATGDLTITGEIPEDPLAVTPGLHVVSSAPGVFDILVNDVVAPVLDDFEVPGGFNIRLNSPGDDVVDFDLTLGGMAGNLSIDMGGQVIGDFVDIIGAGFGDVGGNLTITGGNFVSLIPVDVGGKVLINNSQANVINTTLFEALVGGDFTYLGGNDNDVLATATSFIGGSMRVQAGRGAIPLTLDSLDFGGVMGGSLFYTGSTGGDSIIIPGIIGGNAVINNNVGVNDVVLSGTVAGNLVVSGGFDGDTVDLDPTAIVGGNIVVNVGDGLNDIDLEGTIGGRSVSIRTGLDADSVLYDMVGANVQLFAQLSLGDDDFTLGTAAPSPNPTLRYLYIDFGFGSDTFVNNFVGPFTFPAYLRNLP